MKRIFTILFIFSSISPLVASEDFPTTKEFIQRWKGEAIHEMNEYGIPASITLAQAILESGHGTSRLARKAKNYFGIKCHGWDGATFYKDDDRPDECFRKYKNAATSFKDHSLFLVNNSRYAFLFALDQTDYKGWARGLKKAGYATNPRYPRLLIDIIQKYNLYRFDTKSSSTPLIANNGVNNKNKPSNKTSKTYAHKVYVNKNKTRYIIAGEHDTFYRLAQEFGLNLRQLERWNDFPPHKAILEKGDIVYIMRKRKHIPKEVKQELKGKVIDWQLAQKYGIQLESLRKKLTPQHPMNLVMRENANE